MGARIAPRIAHRIVFRIGARKAGVSAQWALTQIVEQVIGCPIQTAEGHFYRAALLEPLY